MKKLYSLVILFLICFSAFSQTSIYHPFPDSNAVWNMHTSGCCYASCPGPPFGDPYILENTFSRFLSGDTIINGYTYAKMYESGSSHEHCAVGTSVNNWSFYNNNFVGCIRQDTALRIVYRYDPSGDCILYDFNLNVGDSVQTCNNWGDLAVVSSIDSVLIGGNYRKQLNIANCGIGQYSIIEGIGSTAGHFEPYCPFEFSGNLICFSQNGQVLYPDSSTVCNNFTGSVEIADEAQILIHPNPFKDVTTVQISKHLVFDNWKLFDTMGRIIRQENISGQTISVERGNLKPGVYFLQLNGNRHYSQIEKLILE